MWLAAEPPGVLLDVGVELAERADFGRVLPGAEFGAVRSRSP